MTPERWQELERLYHEALERTPGERSAFLDRACAGDDALRRDVDSLLEQRAQAADFIEAPALEIHLPLLSRMVRAVRGVLESATPGLLVGRSLGAYRLEAFIGAGGMGEVYRAVDTRLNRTVAVKVLPEAGSNKPEQRERFRREAKIISSLNHPHVCALYDVGVEDGVDYLVMEHIDGETLQHRLRHGPVPPHRALEHAMQICDALDKAHRRGVVHRDLKPANVMLTKSGVKLLDFGAAIWKAPRAAATSDLPVSDRGEGLTAKGVILGTLQYLSPEQLEGKQADARSDIFAFGAVLYEMIAGTRPFAGDSPAAVIGAILKDNPPPIADSAPDAPAALDRVVARCLAKDPDERFQTANDLLFQLRSIEATTAARPAPARSFVLLSRAALWIVGLLTGVLGTFMWRAMPSSGSAERHAPPIRVALLPPQDTALHAGFSVPFAVSPNGRYIVFLGNTRDGTQRLWLRALSSDVTQPLPGTEGANTPFWSPDSEWIGFFAANSLKKIRVTSRVAQIVSTGVTTFGGATWNRDDVIVFPAGPGGLLRVSARGGPATPFTEGEGSLFWPQFLPDGEHVLYAAASPAIVKIRSLRSGAARTLMTFPVRISSLAYVAGYLFFVQDGSLFVRPFDERRREFRGETVRLLEGIPVTGPGRAPFSVSEGVLAYWSYPLGARAQLRWFDRDGRLSSAVGDPAQYVGFALSPDARHLAFSRITRSGSADVWIRDLSAETERQLTFDGAAYTPHWSPDGTHIVFSGPGQSPPPKLFVKSVTDADPPSVLGDALRVPAFPSQWANGKSIVSVRIDPATGRDIWIQATPSAGAERLWFNTPFNESEAVVSPDGRWMAYVSSESGRDEVHVASFPGRGVRRQVSQAGGTSPQWGANGGEILYLSSNHELVVVPLLASDTGIDAGAARVLFRIPGLADVDRLLFPTSRPYVAASDRFLVAVSAQDSNVPPIAVIVNWRGLLQPNH